MTRFAICCLVALGLAGGEAVANNNLFLPGDAFFYTILTDKELAALKRSAEDSNQVAYPTMGTGAYMGAICGYAGYSQAAVASLTPRFVENLATACKQVLAFEGSAKDESLNDGIYISTPKNGVRVFFYNSSFDLDRYHLGLRYNEDWLEETLKFGHHREHASLCCFVDEPDAVMESWRDSRLVKGLNVVLPDKTPEKHESIDEPLTIQGPVKAIVIPRWSLKDYFARKDGIWFLEVTEDGIRKLTAKDHMWVAASD